MLGTIQEWTLQLAGTIIFASICEMILPNGSIKKYVHIVLGIILILTIVKPLNRHFEYSGDDLFGGLEQYDAYVSHINMDELQKTQVVELYTERLAADMENSIDDITKTSHSRVYAEIETDNINRFGEINSAVIKVGRVTADNKKQITEMLREKYGIDKTKIKFDET